MGELGASYRFENRRDNKVVTSGRVHAARDGSASSSSELSAYQGQLTRASHGSLRKGTRKWGKLSNAESKRKKRVIKYKVLAMEGKVKASFRKGFRWFKDKVSSFVHGY